MCTELASYLRKDFNALEGVQRAEIGGLAHWKRLDRSYPPEFRKVEANL